MEKAPELNEAIPGVEEAGDRLSLVMQTYIENTDGSSVIFRFTIQDDNYSQSMTAEYHPEIHRGDVPEYAEGIAQKLEQIQKRLFVSVWLSERGRSCDPDRLHELNLPQEYLEVLKQDWDNRRRDKTRQLRAAWMEDVVMYMQDARKVYERAGARSNG